MKISTREIVLAAMFTAIMCVVTIMVRIFQPVVVIPFSLQPLVMLLAAYILSPRAAFLSMLAYLLLGLIGIPVFSSPPYGGPAYIFLPSFGFILGFAPAAWVQSKLLNKCGGLINFLLAGVAGVLIYNALGLPYMYIILNYYLQSSVDVLRVIQIGFIPFFTMDLVKVIIAALLGRELAKRLDY
ncbi:MAG: biotin transporter BioY [Syntrophomonadaceae bacterium]|jgi:biotin transport system substrate-specific component